MNTEREIYCVLMSEFVKPKDLMTAMAYLSLAISNFINSKVTSAVIVSAMAAAA